MDAKKQDLNEFPYLHLASMRIESAMHQGRHYPCFPPNQSTN